MRKYWILGVVLIVLLSVGFYPGGLADQPDFPLIYIDEGCAGTHVGSAANPYDDLSDINWTTEGDNSIYDYLAGSPSQSPTIYLNMGDIWRERLIISCSGTATYPIVLDAYGSGADPIINGMDVIEGWAAYSGEEAENYTTLDSDYVPGADAFVTRNVIASGTLTNTGTQVRIRIRANSSTATVVGGTSIGTRSGETCDYSAAPTRITWDTGSEGKTIAAGETAWSDWVNFSLNPAVDHLVHVDVYHDITRAHVIRKTIGISGYYSSNSETEFDEELTQDVNYSGTSNFYCLQDIEIKYNISGTYYVESIGSTTDPGTTMVLVDGTTRLTYNADKDNLSAGEFYHDHTNDDLYVRLTGDADPSGSTIEAQIRRDCIRGGGDDYITVQNIHIKGGFDGIWMYENCNHWTIDSCTFSYVGDHHLKLEGSSGSEDTYNTVSNNTFGINGGCGRTPGLSPFSLRVDWSDNNTIESNVFTNGEYGGIYVTDSDSNIFRYNWVEAEGSNTFTLNTSDSNKIYYNILILNNHDSDWILQLVDGSLNNEIYNNVFYGTTDKGMEFTGNSTGSKFKNNIIENTTTVIEVDDGSETDIAIDYNIYAYDTGTRYDWRGTDYNFSDWQTNSSQDSNSQRTDPVMTDPANDDFTLQATSPCINAGTDVGLTEDYAGSPVGLNIIPPIRPPISIISPFVNPIDIGAYEFGWIY